MKAPICPQTGNTSDCSGNPDGASGHDTRPTERGAWQTPRLYHLDIETGTEVHPIGNPVDGVFLDFS